MECIKDRWMAKIKQKIKGRKGRKKRGIREKVRK